MIYVLLYFLVGFLTFRFWVWRCPPVKNEGLELYLMDGLDFDWKDDVIMAKSSWEVEQAAKICIIFGPFIAVGGIAYYTGRAAGIIVYYTGLILNQVPSLILNLFTIGVKKK